jgi:predicted O-methyltransferase YrrM
VSVAASTLRTARRYRSALYALRALRPVRDPAAAVARARSLSFDEGKFMVQAPEEIGWLLDKVRAAQPHRIVEIGTAHGGTLYLWSRVAPPGALLVAVDSSPLGRLGRWAPLGVLCRNFARDNQRIELVFGGTSQAPDTRRRVDAILAGEPIDFLFIDGDHSYEGVRGDYELYAPLVRPGGLIAFHDIAPRQSETTGVPRFWEELKAEHDTDEIVASSEPSFGIGVVRPRA